MEKLNGLRCRECGRHYEAAPIHVCEFCFGPLEVDYRYDALKGVVTRESIAAGPPSMWRYKDLLPVDGDVAVGHHVGFTPLIRAQNLADELGCREIWVKNDSVCHPTWSFKDRVVSVAITKAIGPNHSLRYLESSFASSLTMSGVRTRVPGATTES